MSDIAKWNGIAVAGVAKWNGIAVAGIGKLNGFAWPSGTPPAGDGAMWMAWDFNPFSPTLDETDFLVTEVYE